VAGGLGLMGDPESKAAAHFLLGVEVRAALILPSKPGPHVGSGSLPGKGRGRHSRHPPQTHLEFVPSKSAAPGLCAAGGRGCGLAATCLKNIWPKAGNGTAPC
jgi:hypothetical protein